MRGLTHTTIDDVRIGIDADGRILIPDADGYPDRLTIGRVSRDTTSRRWIADFGNGEPASRCVSRREAIRALLRRFNREDRSRRHFAKTEPTNDHARYRVCSQGRAGLRALIVDTCPDRLDIGPVETSVVLTLAGPDRWTIADCVASVLNASTFDGPVELRRRKPARYAITARCPVERDGWSSVIDVPTFYLDASVQGITNADHARRIAARMLSDLGHPGAYIDVAEIS